MHSFRLRLILVLVACVTAFRSPPRILRCWRISIFCARIWSAEPNGWASSLQPYLEQTLASGDAAALPALLASFEGADRACWVWRSIDATGSRWPRPDRPSDLLQALPSPAGRKVAAQGSGASRPSGTSSDMQWLEESFPCTTGINWKGRLIVLADAGYIRSEGMTCGGGASGALWRWCCSSAGVTFRDGALVPDAAR